MPHRHDQQHMAAGEASQPPALYGSPRSRPTGCARCTLREPGRRGTFPRASPDRETCECSRPDIDSCPHRWRPIWPSRGSTLNDQASYTGASTATCTRENSRQAEPTARPQHPIRASPITAVGLSVHVAQAKRHRKPRPRSGPAAAACSASATRKRTARRHGRTPDRPVTPHRQAWLCVDVGQDRRPPACARQPAETDIPRAPRQIEQPRARPRIQHGCEKCAFPGAVDTQATSGRSSGRSGVRRYRTPPAPAALLLRRAARFGEAEIDALTVGHAAASL